MNNSFPNKCYWCGTDLSKETNKAEHVPPQGFFPGCRKENLIKVPSCKKHNIDFSALDERFRIYIQSIGSNQTAIDQFKDKTIRGLKRNESKKLVESLSKESHSLTINCHKQLGFEFSKDYTDLFMEKIIRGLYFFHNSKHTEGNVISFSLQFPVLEIDYESIYESIIDELRSDKMKEGVYFYPQIFRYRYANFIENDSFLVVLDFYEGVEFIGLITPC